MEIHVHIHHHSDPVLNEVVSRLGIIEGKIDAMHAETKQLVVELNDATNVLAAKLDTLIANAAEGLTKEEAVAHNAELTALRDHLRAMGSDPANPLPPTP
jgi:hypothetical protein